MKFYKAVVSGSSIPLDEDELEKVAAAIIKQSTGVLVLKEGIIDMRSPVHVTRDPEREKQYWGAHRDEKKDIRISDPKFSGMVKQLADKMRVKLLE